MNIFLSHSNQTEDAQIIELIELGFKLIGINIYIAERDPQPSKGLSNKLKAKIDACDAILVLYTANAATSKEVNWEIRYAEGKKNIFFIVEWGVEKPIAHQGLEHFPLERKKLVDCIYAVCSYFKPYSGIATTEEKNATVDYHHIILPASENSKYKFRIKYPTEHDLTYCPEFVTAEGLCAGCNMMLKKTYNYYIRNYVMECPACESSLSLDKFQLLRDKTISEFIRGNQWKPAQ
jgi:hypothetical protein